MSWLGTVLHYAWRFCTVGSRVMTFAVFATAFSYELFIAWGAHWVLMVFWILMMVNEKGGKGAPLQCTSRDSGFGSTGFRQ